jgi:GNAT superfamily N-acetyltransferase
MEFREIQQKDLALQEELLITCFPQSKINSAYLNWLYFSNPLGNVVGFNAFDGDVLAAHYACIPTRIGKRLGLLSLNTATHPEYRSKGLYQRLARMTYERWCQDFDFVVGVANSKSSTTFVKHLGFRELGRLNLRYGKLLRPAEGARSWSMAEIEWRTHSPRGKFKSKQIHNGLIEITTRPDNFPFNLKSFVACQDEYDPRREELQASEFGFTVDWIKGHQPKVRLPEILKPSPLVLIYQSLSSSDVDLTSWSFPDFDAF